MRVKVIEMPLDFGASRHGADMGPSAIRLAGLQQRLESLGHEVTDYFSPIDIKPADYDDEGNPKAKYLNPIVRSCTQLALAVEESFREGDFPLIIGGDHSIALGSVAGVSAACIRQGKKLGILYVDAHGDFNTAETTLTGNIHGECMAASCGYGLPDLTDLYFKGQKVNPENVCFVGTRDLDAQEKNLMKKAGVTVFSMSDIDRQGFPVILQKIRNFFAEKVDCVHLSFDLDVLDPMFAPGTGIQLQAGLSNREGLMIMEEMCEMGKVCSAEIVELNPVLDIQNKTAVLAVDLIARILGDKIY
ncbi:MAG: arginase [Treponema sp.]|nr:arginase [Spirochaetia bacterium]MDD7450568.1 arginase [Treponema sp.]MDY2924404.1 arginase [Treponema sp.]MDY5682719.1 arginase [Treponema sp.]